MARDTPHAYLHRWLAVVLEDYPSRRRRWLAAHARACGCHLTARRSDGLVELRHTLTVARAVRQQQWRIDQQLAETYRQAGIPRPPALSGRWRQVARAERSA